jgi:hypothetical protein
MIIVSILKSLGRKATSEEVIPTKLTQIIGMNVKFVELKVK